LTFSIGPLERHGLHLIVPICLRADASGSGFIFLAVQQVLRGTARHVDDGAYAQMIEDTVGEMKIKVAPADVGCFVAGTLVHIQDGLVPIEQIKVGDIAERRQLASCCGSSR
jgi:hypothetical protein